MPTATAAMLYQPCHCRGAQPWVTLLLLLGPLFLVMLSWGPQGQAEKEDQSALELYFPATVEYALHEFNLKSRDRNAYKVVRVLKSWREKVGNHVWGAGLHLLCWG